MLSSPSGCACPCPSGYTLHRLADQFSPAVSPQPAGCRSGAGLCTAPTVALGPRMQARCPPAFCFAYRSHRSPLHGEKVPPLSPLRKMGKKKGEKPVKILVPRHSARTPQGGSLPPPCAATGTGRNFLSRQRPKCGTASDRVETLQPSGPSAKVGRRGWFPL